ncbi:FMN-dependent NADH-azoreductase [Jeotgalibacillus soli]|uniref:FMN-dependent NADH-azoreductase n=1 Tax=Jeotgalibacillus soli TaxID=889306 RepID=A0A0C2V8I0_9BACL|nr:FMN-dependent NADH-azoreductase [Jeotgalibacillus soli]
MPSIMKTYIDSIAGSGKTFRYTESDPIGFLPDKKTLHIQARGGIYSEGPAAELEMGHRYLTIMINFFGVPSFKGLFIGVRNQMPDKAQEIKEQALQRAKELAKTY